MLNVNKAVDRKYGFKFYMKALLCLKRPDHWDDG